MEGVKGKLLEVGGDQRRNAVKTCRVEQGEKDIEDQIKEDGD